VEHLVEAVAGQQALRLGVDRLGAADNIERTFGAQGIRL
jgi:hypothetical protein